MYICMFIINYCIAVDFLENIQNSNNLQQGINIVH